MERLESWKGRRVLVTGGASGMGRATVLKLAARGAEVIALDRNRDLLEELARSNSAGSIIPLECDLADAETISRAFKQVGPLNAAVNAAAIGQEYLPLEQTDLRTIDQLIAINFRAVALCMQEELPLIRKSGGGAIVNLSSGGGVRGAPGVAVYSAVKHAVLGLTKSVSAEVAREGIRVNAVCPGLTDTPMLRSLTQYEGADPALVDQMVNTVPLGRTAQPEEIADAILWVLGSGASYVVGACIAVDGGVTAV
jgi:NAD(P)-dependent dehydrogenase (short-subunit alcohol dehydrogenase family)